ncbi:MAG: hypothetical protein ACLTEX_02775 [Eggerthella lenta]
MPSFGYATFLSINATSIWGGIYPYLPAFCQTSLTTIVFYTVQIAVFWLAFCAAMAFTWARPGLSRGAHVLAFSAPLAFGPLMLVGAMYLESLALALVVGAAALIGVGSAGYLMSWQRVFASLDSARGNLALIKGTGFSALLYFFLCFIPTALTAYLIPLVLVPLAGLCLWIAAHATDAQQPMFDDVPREHAVVYKNALCGFLPALSVGALGFCSGAIRFIAVTPGAAQHQHLLDVRAAGCGGRVLRGMEAAHHPRGPHERVPRAVSHRGDVPHRAAVRGRRVHHGGKRRDVRVLHAGVRAHDDALRPDLAR